MTDIRIEPRKGNLVTSKHRAGRPRIVSLVCANCNQTVCSEDQGSWAGSSTEAKAGYMLSCPGHQAVSA